MSRKILFKAKAKSDEQWTQGDVIHEPIGMTIHREKYGMPVRIPVHPDTLCQYTGFTDTTTWEELSLMEQQVFLSEWNPTEHRKNTPQDWHGWNIWENDILEETRKGLQTRRYRVLWDDEEGSWMMETTSGARFGLSILNQNNLNVIGNIFDNPTCMEVTEWLNKHQTISTKKQLQKPFRS